MLGLGAYQSSSEDEGESKLPLTAPKVYINKNWRLARLLNKFIA